MFRVSTTFKPIFVSVDQLFEAVRRIGYGMHSIHTHKMIQQFCAKACLLNEYRMLVKYGLLAAFRTYLIFYSADFRDTAGSFLELSRDGRIGHFSPKMSRTKRYREEEQL